VSQPLYTGGALQAQNRIAQADEKLDQLSEELTRDQIHYQSDAFYWNASSARAMLDASAQYQEIVEKQYEIIQDRFKDGAISRTDLLMISTRRKEAELQYISARQNYTLALQKLNILMGEEPNAPVDSLCSIGVVCPPVTLLPLDATPCRLCQHRSQHPEKRGATQGSPEPVQSASKHVRHRRMGHRFSQHGI
jgi:outer membrane protein TolC